MDTAPGNAKRVMHAMLFLGEGVIMLSDGGPTTAKWCGWIRRSCSRADDAVEFVP